MAPRPVCAFAFALLLATLATQCAAHRRVLAVLDSEDIKSSHSQFLDVLSAGGAEVDVRIVGDNSLKLREYDAFLYDALVLLAPSAASEWAMGNMGHRLTAAVRPFGHC
jgi:Oligosaccharyltransferase 48 kDa subunit beta